MALGGWLGGIAVTAAYLAWFDDRADLGGALLSVSVLAACQLLALATHPGQLDAADPALWAYVAVWVAVLALGLAGVRVAHGDKRYRIVRGPGGVPVEMIGRSFVAPANGQLVPIEAVRNWGRPRSRSRGRRARSMPTRSPTFRRPGNANV